MHSGALRMRQAVLAFGQRPRAPAPQAAALARCDLLEMPGEVLLEICSGSMTTCTVMAKTCKEMKHRLVRAATRGLRVLARSPGLAVRAQRAGLFQVRELCLPRWDKTVRRLIFYCRLLPKLTSIVVQPHLIRYARRATHLISSNLGRRVEVRARSRTHSEPWQIRSAALLSKWIKSGLPPTPAAAIVVSPSPPPSYRSSDIYFDFWHGSGDLGDSTEYEDDSDEEDDPVSYLLL